MFKKEYIFTNVCSVFFYKLKLTEKKIIEFNELKHVYLHYNIIFIIFNIEFVLSHIQFHVFFDFDHFLSNYIYSISISD